MRERIDVLRNLKGRSDYVNKLSVEPGNGSWALGILDNRFPEDVHMVLCWSLTATDWGRGAKLMKTIRRGVHLGKIIAVFRGVYGVENLGGNANEMEVVFEDTQE